MNNIVDITKYNPLAKDKFFFDANIWLYLFCPIGDYKKDVIAKYDKFLKKIIESKSSIFISSLILSEIFNRWARLEYNILKGEEPSKYHDYKRDYRGTEIYDKQVKDIKMVVEKHIMKVSKRIDDKFSSIPLDKLFENMGNYDFNDNYFLTIANLESFKIVTHDSDFASFKTPVFILTANEKVLRRV